MAIHYFIKHEGESMGQCKERFLETYPEVLGEKVAFAGRLDPLACGLVVFLSGEDRYKKDTFCGHPKAYRATIVFGVSSDTGDIMGVVQKARYEGVIFKTQCIDALKGLVGDKEVSFPRFSSKHYKGKPLWLWAREGVLISDSELPKTKLRINAIKGIVLTSYSKHDIYTRLSQLYTNLDGNFGKETVFDSYAAISEDTVFQACICTVVCESGTYIRTLAELLGTSLKTCGVIHTLERIQLGDKSILDVV